MKKEPQENKAGEFVHPSEEEFARILDFYQIPWEYEPRTFPLQWDEEERVTEAFSPDFYLPQQDLYIEVTTLQPHLITKKNGKVRRMKEIYPDVNVRLLKRSDFQKLFIKFGMEDRSDELLGPVGVNNGKRAGKR